MEYYEATKNDRYMIFHHKIQQLLAKPSVLAVLNMEAVKSNTANITNKTPEKVLEIFYFLFLIFNQIEE